MRTSRLGHSYKTKSLERYTSSFKCYDIESIDIGGKIIIHCRRRKKDGSDCFFFYRDLVDRIIIKINTTRRSR